MARTIGLNILPAFILATGCANSDLQRFAPPGIFKYEEIASEKEPNARIEEIVSTREDRVDEKFPVLSETPTAGLKLRRPNKTEALQESEIIIDARDDLTAAVEADRQASLEEREEVSNLEARTDELLRLLEGDAVSALGERKDALQSPDEK